MAILSTRNLFLTEVKKGQSLGVDFESDILDFKEMNTAMIQGIAVTAPDVYDGEFYLMVSLISDANSFVRYPDSEKSLDSDCSTFGWMFPALPFRYAKICYTRGTVSTGTVDIYARAKRT